MKRPLLILGHGASGNATSMQPWVTKLAAAGIEARAIDLPRGNTDRAVKVFREAAEANPQALIGGHSFGGRVASLVAAGMAVPGLVLLSYPLHRPGFPDDLRTQHWPAIKCPVLLLCGESDPFAKLPLLQREVAKLHHAELVTYPSVGHGVLGRADDAVPRIAAFVKSLVQAAR